MENNEYYKFIADEQELKFFFDHVLLNLQGNKFTSYLCCIATRAKKLTEEERKYYGISGSDGVMMREEIISPRGPKGDWTFDNFIQHLYKYECNKKGMVTRNGLPYPDKTLSVLFHCDPADEVKVANALISAGQQIQIESVDAQYRAVQFGDVTGMKSQMEKLANFTHKSKSLHASVDVKMPDGRRLNTTIKTYVHYDFDLSNDLVDNEDAVNEAKNIIHTCALDLYGKGNFFIIQTRGGFHVLVKRTALANAVNYIRGFTAEERKENFGITSKSLDPIYSFENLVTKRYSYKFSEKEGDKEKVHDQVFVPLPGTIQYGSYIPRIVNKEDFDD